jgi:hypothetical protein
LSQHWDLIDADFQEVYGIDTADPYVMDRPWQWFLRRVKGLLTTECRLQRKLTPADQAPQVPSVPSMPQVRR